MRASWDSVLLVAWSGEAEAIGITIAFEARETFVTKPPPGLPFSFSLAAHGAKRTILAGAPSHLRAAVPMLTTAALVTILLCTLAPSARAGPVLFLVAEPAGSITRGDSYVLPLEDPADIEHARALIALGPAAGAPIAVAAIAAGADGVNRDLRAAGAPPWSWHVTGFDGFTDFTIEILDGWPSFVEQDVEGWIANTGGFVGFWSYTVVEELPEPDAAGIALATVAGLGWLGRSVRRRGDRSARSLRAP